MQKPIIYFLSLFFAVGLMLSACEMGTQPGVVAPDEEIPVVEPDAPITDTVVTDTIITDTVATTNVVTQGQAMTATETHPDPTDAVAGDGPLLLAYTLMD